MKTPIKSLFVIILLCIGCQQVTEIETYGQHYQKHNDFFSLNKVVELIDLEVDTSYVQHTLRETH